MATIYEYAQISAQTYVPEQSLIGHSPDLYYVYNYKFSSYEDGWYTVLDTDSYVSPETPFFARLYIRLSNGEPVESVIGFRGTLLRGGVYNVLDNIYEDLKAWYSDVIGDGFHDHVPQYYIYATEFVNKALLYLRHMHISKKPTLTGHSLGGALASMITLCYYPLDSFVFNAPGVGHMPNVILNQAGFIHHFNSKYGIINKVGLTVGHVHSVNTPEMATEAKALLQAFSKKLSADGEKYYKAVGSTNTLDSSIDLPGLMLKVSSLLATVPAVDRMRDDATNFLHCINPAEKAFWSHLNVATGSLLLGELGLCPTKAAFETYADIIMAQHSLENLTAALVAGEGLLAA